MIVIKDDILNVKYGIVCHQVNCKGKMGAGIALSIRKKWPIVYKDYKTAYGNGQLTLGAVVLSVVDPNRLYVANLCGQDEYGRNKRYTNYLAVGQCLSKLAAYERQELPIYIPKGMGCSLAGGDWNIVLAIIEGTLPRAIIVDRS